MLAAPAIAGGAIHKAMAFVAPKIVSRGGGHAVGAARGQRYGVCGACAKEGSTMEEVAFRHEHGAREGQERKTLTAGSACEQCWEARWRP